MWDSMLLHKNCVPVDRGLIGLTPATKEQFNHVLSKLVGKRYPQNFEFFLVLGTLKNKKIKKYLEKQQSS